MYGYVTQSQYVKMMDVESIINTILSTRFSIIIDILVER